MEKKAKMIVPIALPSGLAEEIDILVREGEFVSRNEALKFGARLVVMMMRRVHKRAEDYAYEEIVSGIRRGKKANVS
ncbi:MAG: ribbon-helix-helix domain-containing protein [Nanoarchaeota archaeon]